MQYEKSKPAFVVRVGPITLRGERTRRNEVEFRAGNVSGCVWRQVFISPYGVLKNAGT